MEVTIWQRWNTKKKIWEHNHIEDGWTDASTPTPSGRLQEKAWQSMTWKKTKAKMVDGKIERGET